MTSLIEYNALVSAVERDDVTALQALLFAGVDVNANMDDDIGELGSASSRFKSQVS